MLPWKAEWTHPGGKKRPAFDAMHPAPMRTCEHAGGRCVGGHREGIDAGEERVGADGGQVHVVGVAHDQLVEQRHAVGRAHEVAHLGTAAASVSKVMM